MPYITPERRKAFDELLQKMAPEVHNEGEIIWYKE